MKNRVYNISNWGTNITPKESEKKAPTAGYQSNVGYGGYGAYPQVIRQTFNGENNFGDLGPISLYLIDHMALRMRSHQLGLTNDVCHTIFKRSRMLGIGTGLKLQCEMQDNILKKRIGNKKEEINKQIEALFGVWASDPMCDYSETRNLAELSGDGWEECDKGGDFLAVMRYIDGLPKVQLIDAAYVRTPLFMTSTSGIDVINNDNGNRIRHGVEIDDRGVHVAYWVQKYELGSVMADFVRIECRMKKFPYSETARMIYGDKYRVDSTRGIPIIASVMETAAKIGRYMSASLSSAETRAKMAYFVKHGKTSTGEDPNLAEMMEATGYGYNTNLATDSYGEKIARNVQATTNNMTFNMPVDSELVALESKQEMHINEFFTANMDVVCACVGYSPEVIMSKFGGSYSGSRAAIKDTEHTVDVKRDNYSRQFNQFVYSYCLDVWTVSGRIEIPGYIEALQKQDRLILAALRAAEWKGDAMPHIDPKVEVEAWRAKMGAGTEHIPLCTPEQAQEAMSGLDGVSIMEQTADTLRKADELGIEKVELKGTVIEDFDDRKEDKKGKPGRKGDDKKTKTDNKKS